MIESMSDAVWVAIIGLIGSGLGSLIGVIASSKLTQYRIQQLEKKVEAHNNLINRTYKLESHEQVLDEKIDNIQESINHLRKLHGE